MVNEMAHKKCGCCGGAYPATKEYYASNKKGKFGLYSKCRECVRVYRKKYDSENHESEIERKRKWKADNPNKVKAHDEKYRKTDKRKKYVSDYMRNRKNQDPIFKLTNNIRKQMCSALRGTRKSAKTLELIGCDIIGLKVHLESQFKDGMTWDNYGEWHVDHIIPCASFDFSEKGEQERCFHYSNLQPLWAGENQSKGSKIMVGE